VAQDLIKMSVSSGNFSTNAASRMRLVLQVGEGSSPRTVSIPLRERIVVGRLGQQPDSVQPDLDFTPFGALEKGVSRLHALFTYQDEVLYIEDLESSNGTRINGYQISSHRDYRLRNGDELEFGSLRVVVKVVRTPQ
jgi:pSer/pThr/pTyr-binding forkhead associated (FHA) protein